MTQIEHLRAQARADRLARYVTDAVSVARLLKASEDYRRLANHLEQHSRHGHLRRSTSSHYGELTINKSNCSETGCEG